MGSELSLSRILARALGKGHPESARGKVAPELNYHSCLFK
jgi:hypothetical protein